MDFWLSWKFFTAINIHQIIECSSPFFSTVEILLSFSHLIIHPIHEWSWFYRQFQFCCIVSHDEILTICHFLRIDIIRLPWSITKCFSIPFGLHPSRRIFFVIRSNFSYHSPRSFIYWPWSIVRRRNPILNNLLKRSSPWIAKGCNDQRLPKNLFPYQVALIDHPPQQISQDLDFP